MQVKGVSFTGTPFLHKTMQSGHDAEKADKIAYRQRRVSRDMGKAKRG